MSVPFSSLFCRRSFCFSAPPLRESLLSTRVIRKDVLKSSGAMFAFCSLNATSEIKLHSETWVTLGPQPHILSVFFLWGICDIRVIHASFHLQATRNTKSHQEVLLRPSRLFVDEF